MIINKISNYNDLKTSKQQVYANKNVNFSGKIIDSHMHLGQWPTDNIDSFEPKSLKNLIDKPFDVYVNGNKQQDEVEKVLISNLSCIDTKNDAPILGELEGNKLLLEQCSNNKKFYALAVCQPKYGSADNIRKLLNDNPNKFYGLKFHPEKLKLNANDSKYEDYLKVAKEYKMPCLFHSGTINSYSDPELIYKLAQKQPTVPIILGHIGLGGTEHVKHGANILKQSIENNNAKIYADISWADEDSIVETIKTIGTKNADRLLFGTDAPLGEFGDPKKIVPNYYPNRISAVKTAITKTFPDDAEELIDKIFYKNADELFFKKEWAKNAPDIIKKNTKKLSKSKIGLIVGGSILAVGTVISGIIIFNKTDKTAVPTKPNQPYVNNAIPKGFEKFV